jgi:hypothetical protein
MGDSSAALAGHSGEKEAGRPVRVDPLNEDHLRLDVRI